VRRRIRHAVITVVTLASGWGCAIVAGVDFESAHLDPAALFPDGGFRLAAPPGTDGCPPDQKKCGNGCLSRTDPSFGCGLLDCSPCSLAHSTGATCGVSGACIPKACEPGFDDCDHDPGNGCEADLNRPETCNTCSNKCPQGMLCSPTGCVADCALPLKACNGSCVDTQTNAASCGSCDKACPGGPNADPACVAGACAFACRAGFGDCTNTPAKDCTVLPKWYVDNDEDNYGTAVFVSQCVRPPKHSPNTGDCLDSNPAVHPNAPPSETAYAGPNGPSFDYDCNNTEVEANNPTHFVNCGACDQSGYVPLLPLRAGTGVNNFCGSPTLHVCFDIPMSGCNQIQYDSGTYIKCN
jgi:hypothetical protein